MKYLLIVAAVLGLVAVTYCAPVPTVTVQPAWQQRPGFNPDNHKRPVKDGNCYVQESCTGGSCQPVKVCG